MRTTLIIVYYYQLYNDTNRLIRKHLQSEEELRIWYAVHDADITSNRIIVHKVIRRSYSSKHAREIIERERLGFVDCVGKA